MFLEPVDNQSKMSEKTGKRLKTFIEIIGTIGLLASILYAYLLIRPGAHTKDLSVTGSMLWNGEAAETVSVILCPAGTTPGPSIFGIGGDCDVASAPWTIVDASGEYHFFKIPPGKYTIFYKWPSEDDWNLGKTVKDSYLIYIEEGSVTKVDSISVLRETTE